MCCCCCSISNVKLAISLNAIANSFKNNMFKPTCNFPSQQSYSTSCYTIYNGHMFMIICETVKTRKTIMLHNLICTMGDPMVNTIHHQLMEQILISLSKIPENSAKWAPSLHGIRLV